MMIRTIAVSLCLLGIAAADQIRIDHREGTTGNFGPVHLTTVPNYVLTFDSNGNPVLAAQSGGGGSGSVATDTLWNAVGDLAVGTGADTAARLAKGTALQVLRVNAAGTALEWAAASGGSGDVTQAGNNTFTGTNTFGNVTAAASSIWNLSAATLTLPPISGALTVTTEAYDATGWNADNSVPTKDAVRDKIEALDKTGIIGFTASDSTAVATGKVKGFVVCPYAGTISGWSIIADAGTATVKVWKIASGTAKPTIANVINTSGVALATGTAVISSTVTDFTSTVVTANDIFAFDITAATGCTEITFQLKITKS